MQSAKFARLFAKVRVYLRKFRVYPQMFWFDSILFAIVSRLFAIVTRSFANITRDISKLFVIDCSPFRMQSARLFVKVSGLSANVMLLLANVSRLFAIVARLFAKLTRYISKVRVFFDTRVFGKCYCALIPRDTRCFVKVSCNVVKVTRLFEKFFFSYENESIGYVQWNWYITFVFWKRGVVKNYQPKDEHMYCNMSYTAVFY